MALLSVFSIYFAILGVVMSIATFFLWKTVKRLSTSSFDYLVRIMDKSTNQQTKQKQKQKQKLLQFKH